jgi:hypothetical protein
MKKIFNFWREAVADKSRWQIIFFSVAFLGFLGLTPLMVMGAPQIMNNLKDLISDNVPVVINEIKNSVTKATTTKVTKAKTVAKPKATTKAKTTTVKPKTVTAKTVIDNSLQNLINTEMGKIMKAVTALTTEQLNQIKAYTKEVYTQELKNLKNSAVKEVAVKATTTKTTVAKAKTVKATSTVPVIKTSSSTLSTSSNPASSNQPNNSAIIVSNNEVELDSQIQDDIATSTDDITATTDDVATSTDEVAAPADDVATTTEIEIISEDNSGAGDVASSTEIVVVDQATTTDPLPIVDLKAVTITQIGTDGFDDWVELYNSNDQDVDLAAGNFRLEKTKTAIDPTIIARIGDGADGTYPGGTIIKAKAKYLLVRDKVSAELKGRANAIITNTNFTFESSGYTIYLGIGAISSPDDSDIVFVFSF